MQLRDLHENALLVRFGEAGCLALLSGDGDLTAYASSVQHLFCKHYGVKPFGRGDAPEAGGRFVAINLRALDDLNPKRVGAGARAVHGRAQ